MSAPAADVVSDLATARYDDEPLPIDEIVATVAFLLTAGVETTERALTSLFRHLALNPDVWDEVRTRREDRAFLLSLSAETLRCFRVRSRGSRAPPRPTSMSTAWRSEPAPGVLVSLSSANRDPRVFDEPDAFAPERWLGMPSAVSRGRPGPAVRCRPPSLRRLAAGGDRDGARDPRVLRPGRPWLEPVGELPRLEGLLLNSPPSLPVILHPA